MVRYENGCCDCGLPCIGSSCPYRVEIVLECDRCHDEVDELYEVGSEDLCVSCLKKEFRKEVGD